MKRLIKLENQNQEVIQQEKTIVTMDVCSNCGHIRQIFSTMAYVPPNCPMCNSASWTFWQRYEI